MRAKAKTAAIVLLFALILGIAGRMDKEDAQSAKVQEDELFWDCTTMGNYHCGEPFVNFTVKP